MSLTNRVECIRKFADHVGVDDKVVIHNSPFSISQLQDDIRRNKGSTIQGVMKPYGLWYGIGNSWMNFLLEENMDESWFKSSVSKITIDYSKVLVISDESEFLAFENKFVSSACLDFKFNVGVEWERIEKIYSGIEISPYRGRHRHKSWYYTWDVASGCIWDTSAILSVEEIQ